MTWEEFNTSRIGKVFAMVAVIAAVLTAWTLFTRQQARTDANAPLPGAGTDDPCAIWFIGSSTIRRWDNLAADMTPWKAVRRGVNGATFAQITRRFGQDPARVRPRAIVLYAGENDLSSGAPVDRVAAELRHFLALKERMFPAVPILLLSLKPSPMRWANRPQQLRYNAEAKRLAAENPDVTYVDIGPLLMDGDKPGNHYVADGVHLTRESYRLLAPTLKANLSQRLGAPNCG